MIGRKDKPFPLEDMSFTEAFAEKVRQFLEMLFNFFRPSCSFDEFLKELSEYFDECIIQTEEQKSLKYVDGKIIFELSGNKIEMVSELYFLDESGSVLLHKSSNNIAKSRFNDWDTDRDLQKLSRGEKVEFPYHSPHEEIIKDVT